MTYKEALNKMKDYDLDDEGDEAIEKLSEALEVLRILKYELSPYIGSNERMEIDICCNIRGTGDSYPDTFIKMKHEDFDIIKKWLEKKE